MGLSHDSEPPRDDGRGAQRDAVTLAYYQRNAEAFIARTERIDLSETRERYFRHLPAGARILDVGCGSGRDSEAFVQRGLQVTGLDASPAMVEATRRRCGATILLQRVQDLELEAAFDGIWACASLLHVGRGELPDVLARLARALRPGGVFYASFRYGTEERADEQGRYFNDQTEALFEAAVGQVPSLVLLEAWNTSDLRPEMPGAWLNLLLTRSTTEAP